MKREIRRGTELRHRDGTRYRVDQFEQTACADILWLRPLEGALWKRVPLGEVLFGEDWTVLQEVDLLEA